MFTSPVRRVGILALALTIGTLGLAAPAQAAETGAIVGTLTDGGQPVAGATVQASPVGGGSWGSAETGADGRYHIPDLEAGAYRVWFDAPGHPGQYAFGQTGWAGATQVTVPAGGQVTVDDALLPTGTISGTFRDRAGNGMAVTVRADPTDPGDGANTTAGADGQWTLRVLPGAYRISFEIRSGVYQYAPGALGHATAGVYSVAAGQSVTVDDTLLPTGAVAGRFLDRDGAGMGGVDVSVESQAGPSYRTTTDENGTYRIDEVFTGSYRVDFQDWQRNLLQYAYGKVDGDDADPITVTEGATTTVDDTLLPTGSVHVTATDALTGAPLPAFQARVGQQYADGADGSATAVDVPVGNQWWYVFADGYLGSDQLRVTVTAGATAEVAVSLTPVATISATVVDARTGAPVEGFCVNAVAPTDLNISESCQYSDSEGRVSLDHLKAGAYQLFAFGVTYESPRSPYGAQWVTADGGTGNQSLAAVVTAVAGQTVQAPVVKLDRRGTITGTIRAADGTPAVNGYVAFGNFHYNSAEGGITFPARADGTYTVDFLGPYSWPLHFYAKDHAPQWSGNAPARPAATKVKVRAGKTVAYDITLQRGTKVTVNAPEIGWYAAYHAGTGETSGRCQSGGLPTCDMLVLGSQQVRFKIWSFPPIWHGGTDFATATSVRIPATGTKTVTVTR